jgi:hypothetical protein
MLEAFYGVLEEVFHHLVIRLVIRFSGYPDISVVYLFFKACLCFRDLTCYNFCIKLFNIDLWVAR